MEYCSAPRHKARDAYRAAYWSALLVVQGVCADVTSLPLARARTAIRPPQGGCPSGIPGGLCACWTRFGQSR